MLRDSFKQIITIWGEEPDEVSKSQSKAPMICFEILMQGTALCEYN